MAEFGTRMAALRERFLAQAAQERAALAEAVQAEHWLEVRHICHGIAGRAGMFGFVSFGDAARLLEEAIEAGLPTRGLTPLVDNLLGEAAALPSA